MTKRSDSGGGVRTPEGGTSKSSGGGPRERIRREGKGRSLCEVSWDLLVKDLRLLDDLARQIRTKRFNVRRSRVSLLRRYTNESLEIGRRSRGCGYVVMPSESTSTRTSCPDVGPARSGGLELPIITNTLLKCLLEGPRRQSSMREALSFRSRLETLLLWKSERREDEHLRRSRTSS